MVYLSVTWLAMTELLKFQYHAVLKTDPYDFKRKKIFLGDFIWYKHQLLLLNNINPLDIMNLFIKDGEEKINPIALPEYSHSMPHYQKMLHRFKDEGFCIIGLYYVCNMAEQKKILSLVFLKFKANKDLVEFFQMLKYNVGLKDLQEMRIRIRNNSWRNNVIEFFYNLDKEKQIVLINRYNNDYIKDINSIFNI